MGVTGRKELWGTDALTFSQSNVGAGVADGGTDMWDDGAILKAFDDALSTHARTFAGGGEENRKPSTYGRSQGRHDPAAPVLLQSSGRTLSGRYLDVASSSTGQGTLGTAGHGDRTTEDGPEHQATENRPEVPRVKGGMETLQAGYPRRGAGIAGPWEPVAPPYGVDRDLHALDGPGEVQPRGTAQDYGQRSGYPRSQGGPPYDAARYEDYGPQYYSYAGQRPSPSGGPPHVGEGFGRHGPPPPPPPPPPPLPYAGVGPHAAAFQSLEGIHDDELADLLLAWYYSGYYTGRFRAMQEARSGRYRRPYPPPPPSRSSPTAPHANTHGDGWERPAWNGYHPPSAPVQSPDPNDRAGSQRASHLFEGRSAINGMGRRPAP